MGLGARAKGGAVNETRFAKRRIVARVCAQVESKVAPLRRFIAAQVASATKRMIRGTLKTGAGALATTAVNVCGIPF